MRRPIHRLAHLLAVGAALAAIPSQTLAQGAICPAPAGTFIPSTDTRPIWNDLDCTCRGLQTSVGMCSGPGSTYAVIDGVPGSLLISACVITPPAYICPLPPTTAVPSPPPPENPGWCPNGECPWVGAPVSVFTGEMYFTHRDATVGFLSFDRTFNTARRLNTRYGMFGPGWNSSFDKRLNVYGAIIEARGPDGAAIYYDDRNSDGTFVQQRPFSPDTWIVNTGVGYNVMKRAGGQDSYSLAGLLLTETDAAGATTTYTRDGSNRLTSITREGRTITITYVGAATKPATLQGPTGETIATYTYDVASGRLLQVDYPDSAGYRYVYDASGRLSFVDHADGRPSESHEYDAQSRALTSETGDGRDKVTLSYDSPTQTTVTDALGRRTIYEFQSIKDMNRITKITGPCDGACGAGAEVREWVFDPANGQLISEIDQAGKTRSYTYDPVTLDKLTETNSLNQTTTFTYDAQGRMLTRTGPDGAVTTYVQSDPGPTSITQTVTASPLVTRTTTLQYFNTADARAGKVETITDPRGKVTTMAYNTTTGDLTSVTDPLGHSTTFGYDEAPSPAGRGHRTSVTDALGHVTKTVYEGRGRLKKVINHDLTFTEFAYDAAGRRSTVTDPMGRVTRYIYDQYGRLDTVVDPMNQSTRYSYDLMGNLLTLTDAKGQTTTFEYDRRNRVKKTIYPGGAFETFAYDSRGRLATMIDRKNITTTYTYDDLGRLTGKAFTNDPSNTPAFSYSYDLAGRMLTAQNGTDALTWTYNLAGELLSEQSVKNSSTVAYTYDNGGNRLTVSLDGQLFVSYGYDDASRLTTITRGANVFGFGYDNANRRTSMTYPNGVTTSYSYDNLNRLTNLAATHVPSSTPITNFGYQYDAAGNRTQKSTLDYTEDYGYDPLYRLTRTDRTNPGATPPNQWTWNYDAVGNRTSAQKDSEATTSSYNEKNQLTGATGGGKMLWRGTLDEPGIATFSAPTINGQPARMLAGNVFEATLDLPAGANNVTIQAQDGSGNVATKNYSVNVTGAPASYTYDANGNLATKTEGADSWTYSWDAKNQLTTVSKNSVTQASYSYDPLGRRVEQVAGAATISWVYEGEDILRQIKMIGGVPAVTFFTHGPGIDEPMAQSTASATEYLHADVLGSIVRETAAAGAVSQTISYDAWGNIQSGAPALYGFTGREWDASANLYYYRARYYDSQRGRFLSEDPLGFDGEDLNFTRYAGNDPINWNDPGGLMKLPAGPGDLGPDWKLDPSHKDPNGQRFRDPNGRPLDFHPGKPGKPGWEGKDHWHLPDDEKPKWHYKPGDEIADPLPETSPMACESTACKVTVSVPILAGMAFITYKLLSAYICPPLIFVPF